MGDVRGESGWNAHLDAVDGVDALVFSRGGDFEKLDIGVAVAFGCNYEGAISTERVMSLLKDQGIIEAQAVHQRRTFEAGVQFARTEGILPAPEPTHAISVVIDEALKAKAEGVPRTILFNLSGHGHFDMQAYTDYFAGKLEDRDYDEADLAAALAALKLAPAPRGPVPQAEAPPERVEVTLVADAATYAALAPALDKLVGDYALVAHLRRA